MTITSYGCQIEVEGFAVTPCFGDKMKGVVELVKCAEGEIGK